MEFWLWIAIAGLLLLLIILVMKIRSLHQAARDIETGFTERLGRETNTLIDLSTGDRTMRHLANSVNRQLRSLRQQRHRFRQGDLELKTAVTNISHDLRTPLTAICGYLDLLEQEELSTQAEEYLHILRNRTDAMIELTEELLSYSVSAAEGRQMKQEAVDVGSVLEDSLAAFYLALKERGIEPDISIPQKRVICRLDRSALMRVIANLLNNAIKYSDGDLKIELSDSGILLFENTASGLNEVQVGKLFDRFYTVEAARESTGLGLSIARTLMEQMNGTISARYANERLSIRVELPKPESE